MKLVIPTLNDTKTVGHLTSDAKTAATKEGTKVVFFSVAFNRRYKDKDGNWKDAAPAFIPVSYFGKSEYIEGLASKLKSGVPVYVEGELVSRERTFEGLAKPITMLSVKASKVQILHVQEKAAVAAAGADPDSF